jgi:hypothetical protein
VIKALAHHEETTRHWFDALSLIRSGELDWDHVLERAAFGPHRVLALLHYAVSIDLLVPQDVIRRLSAQVLAAQGALPDET